MVRGLLSFGGLFLAAGAALFAGLKEPAGVDLIGIFRPVREIDAAFQRGFRSDAMVRANRLRSAAGVGEIRVDEPIQAFVGEWVASHPRPLDLELDEVFDAVQRRFPGAQYLAANLLSSGNREELLDKLSGWTAVASADFDAVSTAVFPTGRRFGALAVLSRRIPEFSLRAANERGGRFHNQCPHCETIHALELDREARTLILSCPHCDLPFDVLAMDSEGRVRRAMEYLEGFSLSGPESVAGAAAEDRIVELWRRVAEHCEYQLDQDRDGDGTDDCREVWKSSRQTWAEAAGDCEDTSILLADLLIGAGFEARVAIGWNGNIGQHAWVVVRCGERQYLIETTLQKEIVREDLAEVVSVAAFYQPEQLFDRTRLYYSTARPDHFGSDYFGDAIWRAVPDRAAANHAAR